jgi:hypothetical protein
MNTISVANTLSDYSSRLVTVTVSKGGHQQGMRKGAYTMTIPHSSLSQTIRSIHRFGGKITNVEVLSFELHSQLVSSDVLPKSTALEVLDVAVETESNILNVSDIGLDLAHLNDTSEINLSHEIKVAEVSASLDISEDIAEDSHAVEAPVQPPVKASAQASTAAKPFVTNQSRTNPKSNQGKKPHQKPKK